MNRKFTAIIEKEEDGMYHYIRNWTLQAKVVPMQKASEPTT